MRGLTTLPRSWPGLVAPALALASGSVADLAGARSVGVSHSFRGMARSRGYFRNVNISNTRITNINNITNNYYNNRNGAGLYGRNGVGMPRYANTPGALTAVSRNTLERGLPVAANAAKTSPSALRNLSSASIGRPNVSPTRAEHAWTESRFACRKTVCRSSIAADGQPNDSAGKLRQAERATAPAHNTATPASSRAPEGPSTSAGPCLRPLDATCRVRRRAWEALLRCRTTA